MDLQHSTKTINKGQCSLTVQHYGATLTSLVLKNKEILFLSSKAVLDNSKAIRGGIPVVFPTFGPHESLPQHGFARTSIWLYAGIQYDSNDKQTIAFELNPTCLSPEILKLWPYSFQLKLCFTLDAVANSFTQTLSVKNTGLETFLYNSLLHTYLSCVDIANVRVESLDGCSFTDKVLAGAKFTHPTGQPLEFDKEVDRIFEKVPDNLAIKGTCASSGIKIVKQGFTDVVCWNPWSQRAKAMTDFDDEDYKIMLCVEVGSVSKPVSIAPSGIIEASQTLSLLSH